MIKELAARGLVAAGKALLTILPEPQREQCEMSEALEYFTETSFLVMSTNEYQSMPDAKKLQFQGAMTSALGVFFGEREQLPVGDDYPFDDIQVDDYDAFGEDDSEVGAASNG